MRPNALVVLFFVRIPLTLKGFGQGRIMQDGPFTARLNTTVAAINTRQIVEGAVWSAIAVISLVTAVVTVPPSVVIESAAIVLTPTVARVITPRAGVVPRRYARDHDATILTDVARGPWGDTTDNHDVKTLLSQAPSRRPIAALARRPLVDKVYLDIGFVVVDTFGPPCIGKRRGRLHLIARPAQTDDS